MNKRLCIAMYGSVLAIALALRVTDYGEEDDIAVSKESLSELDQNAEDGDLDKNQPQVDNDENKKRWKNKQHLHGGRIKAVRPPLRRRRRGG